MHQLITSFWVKSMLKYQKLLCNYVNANFFSLHSLVVQLIRPRLEMKLIRNVFILCCILVISENAATYI